MSLKIVAPHYITGDEPGWKISPKFCWSAERNKKMKATPEPP